MHSHSSFLHLGRSYVQSGGVLVAAVNGTLTSPVRVTILSKWSFYLIMAKVSLRTLLARRELYSTLSGVPGGEVMMGWAFEYFVHEALSNNGLLSYRTCPLVLYARTEECCSIQTSSPNVEYPRRLRRMVSYDSTTEVPKCLGTHENDELYCFPAQLNKPGFDSFVLSENKVDIFHMTLSNEIAIDKGLDLLEGMIPDLLERQWRYFVVLPDRSTTVTLISVTPKWRRRLHSFNVMVVEWTSNDVDASVSDQDEDENENEW